MENNDDKKDLVKKVSQIISENIGANTGDLFLDVYKNETDGEKIINEAKKLLERSLGPEATEKQLASLYLNV